MPTRTTARTFSRVSRVIPRPARLAPLAGLPLLACGPELPAGWEDALPVDDMRQGACDGSPYEDDVDEVVQITGGDPVEVAWDRAQFRCAQDVEGFYKVDGALLELLVQPIDMHPTTVAKCDCLYRLDFSVPEPAPDAFKAWRRWDALNDPNEPVLVWDSEVDPSG